MLLQAEVAWVSSPVLLPQRSGSGFLYVLEATVTDAV